MQKRTAQPASILMVASGRPRSACPTEQQTLLEDFLADCGWLQTLDQLPDAQGNNRATGPIAALDLLRRFVRSLPGCDIVHCHLSEPGLWTLVVLIQVLIARFFGKPLLVDLRDCIDRLDDENLPVTLRMILALSAVAAVPSEQAAANLARNGYSVHTIPEAIADGAFSDRLISSVQPGILTTLPAGDQAALNCLAKAFRLVKEKYPRTEMTIIGDDRDREDCLRTRNGGTAGGINFVSVGDNSEAQRCYSQCDLYVSPCPETGRQSTLRAMAAGLPVVAAADGGQTGLIKNRCNGLIFRWSDPGALADRVVEIIETPELVSELSSQGRATADAHRWSKFSRRWMDCYHRLLSTTPIRDAVPRRDQRVSVPLQTPISSK